MEDYELSEPIGYGSFSVVYKARKRGEEGYFAVKIAKIEENPENCDENWGEDRILTYDRERIAREIELWKPLDHENLCRLLDVFFVDEDKKVAFIMEYAKDGDLLTILGMKSLPTETIRSYFKQLCRAVGYLHERGLVHGDIKLENILVDGENIKLSDFGLARRIGEASMNNNCGTVEYAAPELLQEGSSVDPLKADIWALGVALYALIYGQFPFDGPTPKVLKIRILTTEPLYTEIDGFSELISLTKVLLDKNPNRRPCLKEILEVLHK